MQLSGSIHTEGLRTDILTTSPRDPYAHSSLEAEALKSRLHGSRAFVGYVLCCISPASHRA